MAKRCQRSSAAEARQSTLTPCSYVSHRMTQSMRFACFIAFHLYSHRPVCAPAGSRLAPRAKHALRVSATVARILPPPGVRACRQPAGSPRKARAAPLVCQAGFRLQPCAPACTGASCRACKVLQSALATSLRKQALVYFEHFELLLHMHLGARGKCNARKNRQHSRSGCRDKALQYVQQHAVPPTPCTGQCPPPSVC